MGKSIITTHCAVWLLHPDLPDFLCGVSSVVSKTWTQNSYHCLGSWSLSVCATITKAHLCLMLRVTKPKKTVRMSRIMELDSVPWGRGSLLSSDPVLCPRRGGSHRSKDGDQGEYESCMHPHSDSGSEHKWVVLYLSLLPRPHLAFSEFTLHGQEAHVLPLPTADGNQILDSSRNWDGNVTGSTCASELSYSKEEIGCVTDV